MRAHTRLTCTAFVCLICIPSVSPAQLDAGPGISSGATVSPEQAKPRLQFQAHAAVVPNLRAIPALAADGAAEAHPTRLLVRFRAGTSRRDAEAAKTTAKIAASLKKFRLVPGLELVEARPGQRDVALKSLRADPNVFYAEPDYVVRALAVPNDPSFSLLWGLNNTGQTVNQDFGTAGAHIRATSAWNLWTGDPNFRIAVIDSGVNFTHPDLAPNLWTNPGEVPGDGVDNDGNGYVDDVHGFNTFLDNGNAADDNGHGSHVAGTIGARGNNGVGIAGVNWQCRLVAVKFLSALGEGSVSDAVEALQYVTDNNIKVSNNSWGSSFFAQSLYDAIQASQAVGHIFVAAAGNGICGTDIDQSPTYPAGYGLDNIISVAATDNDDRITGFSMFGSQNVDLGAPGDDVFSTWLGTGYAYLRGTSMAAPHVTGVVALVYSKNPGWNWQTVRNRVLTSARPIPALTGKTVSGGVVDAVAALGDCNANGIQDSGELPGHDCNGNGRLDACEPDCDSNGIADPCDITAGAADCNANAMPDRCEVGWNKDCNANGVPDLCDLHIGIIKDCNLNAVPDSCDIATGTTENCNGNFIPDDCERDCNDNGIADSCELSAGTAFDLDDDGFLDECAVGFAMVPISATGPHAIEGRQIFLPQGGQRVTLEMRVSGWDPDQDGQPRVRAFEAAVETGSFATGQAGTLAFASIPCAGDGDCFHGDATQSVCEAGGVCDALSAIFPDQQHPRYILKTFRTFALSNYQYFWSGGFVCEFDQGAVDRGGEYYVGTVVLYVPPGAAGTFVIDITTDDDLSFLVPPTDNPQQADLNLPIPGFHAALITLPADCNANGIDDACDTSCGAPGSQCHVPGCGTAADCNGDRTPDVCIWAEVDCNANQVPDECDIANGTSEDCNGNQSPDECELNEPDCNENNIPDSCDIASGASQDCANDSIPDECEPDCNLNEEADSCDIQGSTSDDCNGNAAPDECDLGSGAALDCNDNAVPDSCDVVSISPDCNNNDIPDECDISGGASLDCDANQIPDECVTPDSDCNDNSIPDLCDIAGGFSMDCDLNGTPDDCEDCNDNGLADVCDIDEGASSDDNGNGVPDECDHILYVDQGAAGAGTGLNWANAYVDLQDALDVANQSANTITEIWIAEGIYFPDRQTGNQSLSFLISRDFSLFGGFGGTDRQFAYRDPVAHPTILSGDTLGDDGSANLDEEGFADCHRGSGIPFAPGCDEFDADDDGDVDSADRVLAWHATDNSHHVVSIDATVSDAVLDGLTIRGGNAWSAPSFTDGGGVWVRGAVTFVHCVVEDNRAQAGAGIFCGMGSPQVRMLYTTVQNNWGENLGAGLGCLEAPVYLLGTVFQDNWSRRCGGASVSQATVIDSCVFRRNHGDDQGGGLFVSNAALSPLIIETVFEDNTCDGQGGGVYIFRGTPNFVNCSFRRNHGAYGGGAYNDEGSPRFVNTTFTGNVGGGGGAFESFRNGNPTLINCTLFGNAGSNSGGIQYSNYTGQGELSISNCILWGNTSFGTPEEKQIRIFEGIAEVKYTTVEGWTGSLGGTGNNGSNPLFADAIGPDGLPATADEDFTLLPGSPCIDAGDNDALPADSADLDSDGDTVERMPRDAAGNSRTLDDPAVEDTGRGTYPIVDRGPFEAGLDCNSNGVIDSVDIAQGGSDDCTGNAVPDECEPDCDGNQEADSCDLASGVHEDCNGNARPDLCDVASIASPDCNDNGIPDECEPDADSDGAIDACDGCPLDGGKTQPGSCGCGVSDADADLDSVPNCHDICQGHDDLTDADADSVPDGCDACAGFDDAIDSDDDQVANGCDQCPGFIDQLDSDQDGVPNGCDVCPGFDDALDCNANVVPDGCDVVTQQSPDTNANGVPDECEPPAIEAEGSRYLRITPVGGLLPVALRVRSNSFVCMEKFIDLVIDPLSPGDDHGVLVDEPVYRLGDSWNEVRLRSPHILPGAQYRVSALTEFPTGVFESEEGVAATWALGEVNHLAEVNILDVGSVVDRVKFEGAATTAIEAADLTPCTPDGRVNVLDIGAAIDALKAIPYACPPPCP